MEPDKDTNPEIIKQHFDLQHNRVAEQGKTTTKYRIGKLKELKQAIVSRRQAIRDALKSDFNKSEQETDLSEIFVVTSEIDHIISHLKDWMSPRAVGTPLVLIGTHSEIQYRSKGNVLIISPWNFPFNLALAPLAASFAAGNCTIIKPSEFTPNTNLILGEIIREVFEPGEAVLIRGGAEVSRQLLELPFHHIFFTGSTRVGRLVMKAAAEHLATVTLELGGKSPVIVDRSAEIDDAAMRIAWGKWLNAGQTCIAPDYVLAHAEIAEELTERVQAWTERFYGQEPESNPDYTGIISPNHQARLQGLGGTAPIGGKMKPTVKITTQDDPAMCEEIFGPVLPILKINNMDEGIKFVNSGERPLALYIFARNKKIIDLIIRETRSGGIGVNETLLHFFNKNLPFGGANHSGMGRYHGFAGFTEFSHSIGILKQSFKWNGVRLIMPPYSALKKRMIDLILRWL